MVESDVKACSQIVYDAFRTVAERHGFQAAFPTIEVATRVVTLFVGLPSMYKLIAEHAAHPVGAIFLDEGDPIRAIAIVAVDPAAQARGVGRALRTPRWSARVTPRASGSCRRRTTSTRSASTRRWGSA